MTKKIIFTSICAMLSFGAFAEMPQPPMDMPASEKHPGMDIMANLTEEQKTCIQDFGCIMPEKPDINSEAVQPDQKPEMTDEQREYAECMKDAMESCGVEIPQMPEQPTHEMPPAPGMPAPDMPPAPEAAAQ